MVMRALEPVIAAVNADFFTPEGNTVGVEIVDGQVFSVANRPTFAWRAGSPPWIGIASGSADGLDVGWPVSRDRGDGTTEAVGGFPDLIDAGDRVADLEVESRPTFAAVRHPRTAVAYDSARGFLWLVVVDGRQMPYSAGMTLPELTLLFEALGADEALNLDGGGSSALVLRDSPVNRPSDATGERPVVNALALVRDPGQCSRVAPATASR
jgi:exopolysaccharide biosynthesis protein